MRWKRFFEPRMDAPLPAWTIFPVLFAALYASHYGLLRLPYYWDEAGYYIPAAWDFFRTGSLIPQTTLTNGHPPLPSVYLALWWRATGFLPEVTREAVLLVAALGLTAVWRLTMRLTGAVPVAFWTVLLTALYPIWFVQSSLAHADIFAAACSLWGLVYALPGRDRRPVAAAAWFSAAALAKETAIVIPLALALVCLAESLRALPPVRRRLLGEAAWLAACTLPLAAWYLWHWSRTGFFFGNPEFLRYNAEANLSPLRFLAAFFHRFLHLTAHMNLFVPVLMAAAAMMLDPRPDAAGNERARIDPASLRRIAVLLLANLFLFSVLGGALLTRYLLPMHPLVLLVAVTTLYRRAPLWQALTAISAGAFVLALVLNPPYRFAPEDNLAYARVIRLHQAGVDELTRRYPGATVLTAWPISDELARPELGYLREPFQVYVLPDFTPASIARAGHEPERYSAALVFSTKYDPQVVSLSLGRPGDVADERYFGMHHDMAPEAIARELGGELVWHGEDRGQWIGLIRFNRQFEARAEAHPRR
ncbi:MAG: glycosyltransferase [Terracidiphilus sp.]